MFNKIQKFTAEDVYQMIETAGQVISSDNDIHKFNNDPTHLHIHQVISSIPNDELETYMKRRNTLLDIAISKKSYLAYASLLHKGLFREKLSEDQIWLLDNIKPLNLDVYQNVFHTQYRGYSSNPTERFIYSFLESIKNMTDSQKEKNKDTFIAFYGEKLFDLLNNKFAINFASSLIRNGFDINKNFPLNRYLPNDKNGTKQDFFISALDDKFIKPLLESGYRFDEENYRFNGDTLMTTLLKSGRFSFIDMVLPYLKNFTPADGDLEKHNQLLEKHKNQPYYLDLKSNYDYHFLQQTLTKKEEKVKNRPKI